MRKLSIGLMVLVLTTALTGCYTRSCRMSNNDTQTVKQTVTTKTIDKKVEDSKSVEAPPAA